MTEQSLIDELKRGNTRVLKHVYQNLDSIIPFVLKNSGTKEDAYDLFQEAVIIFHRNVLKENFELTAPIGSYIFGICRRLWLNQLRNEKKKVTFMSQNTQDGFIKEFEFELPQNENSDLADNLSSVIQNLGEPCKRILDLFYFQKMGLEQIKEKLSYSSSQVVRQQKYRCLKRIKEKVFESRTKK